MTSLVEFANVASSLILLVGMFAAPLLFFWGRRYFAERGTLWTPMQVRDAIGEALDKAEHRIREDMHSVVGNMGNTQTQRHEQIVSDLRDVKEFSRAASTRADAAHEKAVEALHRSDIAVLRVETLEKVIDSRLTQIDGRLGRIETALNARRRMDDMDVERGGG